MRKKIMKFLGRVRCTDYPRLIMGAVYWNREGWPSGWPFSRTRPTLLLHPINEGYLFAFNKQIPYFFGILIWKIHFWICHMTTNLTKLDWLKYLNFKCGYSISICPEYYRRLTIQCQRWELEYNTVSIKFCHYTTISVISWIIFQLIDDECNK